MTRSGKMRLAASLVTVVWICLEIWAVGPVMRESDQASLLEGAVQLVESWDPDKRATGITRDCFSPSTAHR